MTNYEHPPVNSFDARARLCVTPGDGYVTRRETAVLFTSPGGLALVDAFSGAVPSGVIEAVTECAEGSSFVDGPFVVISWHNQWRVALYGEIEVVSDHASLSRLSGASSSTWVERQLRMTQMTIGVRPSTADDHTDLVSGTVAGNGFALSLVPSEAPPRPPETPASVAAPPAANPSIEVVADDTLGVPRPPAALEQLVSQRAARGDVTIDVPVGLLSSSAAGEDSDDYRGWRLRSVDGPTEPVGTALVLGRRPTVDNPADGARLITIDCPLVSSTHVRIEVDEIDGLVVTDLGSSNGTWIATSGDGQPIQLVPREPTPLEAGTPLQIGSKIYFVERY